MKKILVSLILFISVFLITKDMVFMLLLNSSNDKMVKAYFKEADAIMSPKIKQLDEFLGGL